MTEWVCNVQNYIRDHIPVISRETDISDCVTEIPDLIQLECSEENFKEFCGEERVEFGTQYGNKNPIVVFGCSYAYGHGLKRKDTFPSILSEITKRQVYSYAQCSSDIIWSMDKLRHETRHINEIKNADYYIYIYMYDHVNRYTRLTRLSYFYDDIFNTKNTELIADKLLIIRMIKSALKIRKVMQDFPNGEAASQIVKTIMLSINKQIKSFSPNAKFIIIIYDEKIPKWYDNDCYIKFESNVLNSHIWNELNAEQDITVVHTKDLTGFYFDKEYKLKADIADWHPNEKVWKLLTPIIAEKYIK